MENIIAFIVAINVVIAGQQSIQTHVTYTNDMAELIFQYYHNYKHIKRLSLFLCNDQNAVHHDLDQSNIRTVNIQQMVKQLMASAKFAIKGIQNIDEITQSSEENGNYSTIESIDLIGMLDCSDFKQGVVLDLRCRQSDYILQQVKGLFVHQICLFIIHRHLN